MDDSDFDSDAVLAQTVLHRDLETIYGYLNQLDSRSISYIADTVRGNHLSQTG